jgi:predicted transcriptional regulator
MAMTIRLPAELDAQLQGIADARHTSKHSLVLHAVGQLVSQETKTERVLASAERTIMRDADVLARLADA